jgi:hypothetical protein
MLNSLEVTGLILILEGVLCGLSWIAVDMYGEGYKVFGLTLGLIILGVLLMGISLI